MSRRQTLLAAVLAALSCSLATAQDMTWRKDVRPLVKKLCDECHGASSPSYAEFKLDEERYKKAKEGPRLDTYEHAITLVGWPGTGAMMRRLDDGKGTADGKPGNMYKYLGETDEERAAALKVFKAWVGEGAWKLNRWKARGNVPAAAKEDLEKLKLEY